MYYVYILKCADNTLYTGITADIGRRMAEHFCRTKKCARYTRSHKAEKLEALWSAENRSLASRLECRIKKLTRTQKLRLISEEICLSSVIGMDDANYERLDLNNAEPPHEE